MAKKTSAPISEKRSGDPTGCLVVFGLIFFLAGAVSFFFAFMQPALRIVAARSWTAVPCVISTSQVASTKDSDGDTTYRVNVTYNYQVNGQNYTGDVYAFGASSSSNYSSKNTIVTSLPPGTRTTCYVNPSNHTDAVLMPGASGDLWIGLVTLIFVAVGLIIMIVGVRMGRAGKSPHGAVSWQPKGATAGLAPGMPENAFKSQTQLTNALQSGMGVNPYATQSSYATQTAGTPMPGGPVTLKPSMTRFGTFIFLLFFSLFWNGIVSVFLLTGFRSRSSFDVVMFLFLIPFVLVGLGMIGATVYQFIALFGPKIEVTVPQAAFPLGGTLNLTWQLRGNRNVQKLKIYLEGREEATYRRGTDTYTDKNIFCRLDVAEANGIATKQGSGQVQIPIDTMHSFEARNNKIVWRIIAQGEIPIWPDLKEEYPIAVLPRNEPTL